MSTWTQQIDPSVQPADWKGDTPPGEKHTIFEMDYALIKNMTLAEIEDMTLAASNPTAWTASTETASTWETE